MTRLFAASLALALGAAALPAADKKEQTPGEIYKELRTKFAALPRKKGEEAERREKLNALLKEYAGKFQAYAVSHKDAGGAEALIYTLQLGEDNAKTFAALRSDHARKTKLGKLVRRIPCGPTDPEGTALLREVAANNKDRVAQAYAYKTLLQAYERAVEMADRINKDDDLKERAEKAYGKEKLRKILAYPAATKNEAKEYKAKIEGELKDVFPALEEGKPAPEATSEDLDGKPVKLSDLKGKVVVLDFWATWCGPCREMIPSTRDLVKKMDGKPFVFVSVSADDEVATVKKFIKEKAKMPWTHWFSGQTGLAEDWDVEAFPSIFIIDAKGVLRKKIVGGDEEEVERQVEKLVKEAEKKAE